MTIRLETWNKEWDGIDISGPDPRRDRSTEFDGYLTGELQVRLAPLIDKRGVEQSGGVWYAKPPFARLPHSCDEWMIGGPNEIRALIADLQEALEAMG
jgi:hypothetical protein